MAKNLHLNVYTCEQDTKTSVVVYDVSVYVVYVSWTNAVVKRRAGCADLRGA